jgi:cytochrome c oxidase assembly factor CtaG
MWRTGAFLGGTVTVAIALLSPLDLLSGQLLSAHMIQHLLLLLVAPMLLVLGRPVLVMRWSLPLPVRRRWARAWHRSAPITARLVQLSPQIAAGAYTVVLWLWHIPALYEAALTSTTVHITEHGCFFSAALLLWWVVLSPAGGKPRYGIRIALLLVTAAQGSALGALLTFSTVLWYPANFPTTFYGGLTPLGDQQLAGLLMWIPPGIVYLGAIAMLLALWLAALEQGIRRRERLQARKTRAMRSVEPASRSDGD